MEKRAILAAVLIAGLLLLYQALFAPAPSPPPPSPVQAPVESKPALAPVSQPVTLPQQVERPASSPPIPAREVPEVPERVVPVDTPLYRAVVSSRGGDLTGWDLAYRGRKPMVLPGLLGPEGVKVVRVGLPPRGVGFQLATEGLQLDKDRPKGELRLVGEDGFGLRLTQILRFRTDNYVVERELRVENHHKVAQSVELEVEWVAPVEWPKEYEGFAGPRPIYVVHLAQGAFWAARDYLSQAKPLPGEGQWVAFESGMAPTGQNGVYLTALIPRSPGMQLSVSRGSKVVQIGLRVRLTDLPPGGNWRGSVLAYVGPMEYHRLVALGVGLEKGIYFGGFPFPESWARRYGVPTIPMQWIVVPILWLMNSAYGFIRNYGVAIVLLTVVTKVLFYPLSVKSMASMKAMQALQPQINQLRAKYQKDPQRLQRETMELYRKHKVNPMGGCLPMLVQIPVFYALYVALSVSAELQNSPFIRLGVLPKWVPWLGGQCVWICDLAVYDPTYILPILMGASMFIQQKMTPTVGDPRQAKIMLLMPVIFTFMFLNLPSGLVLYWFVSNVLQILQQYYIDRAAKPTTRGTGREAKEGKHS